MERKVYVTLELLAAMSRLPLADEVVVSKFEYFYRRHHDIPNGQDVPFTLPRTYKQY